MVLNFARARESSLLADGSSSIEEEDISNSLRSIAGCLTRRLGSRARNVAVVKGLGLTSFRVLRVACGEVVD